METQNLDKNLRTTKCLGCSNVRMIREKIEKQLRKKWKTNRIEILGISETSWKGYRDLENGAKTLRVDKKK